MRFKAIGITCLCFLLSSSAMAEVDWNSSVSNLNSWVGVDINIGNASNIPSRVSTSPDFAILGMFRSLVFADPDEFAFHLSPSYRAKMGADNEDGTVKESFLAEFQGTPNDTNIIVKSVSLRQGDDQRAVFTLSIEETTMFEVFSDTFPCELVFTNGGWKVNCMANEYER